MKVNAKFIQIGILAFCVQSSAMAVTTAEVILDVFTSYGTLAKDFLANNSEMLFVLAGGKLKPAIPAEQIELSFGVFKKGLFSAVGGVSSLWGMLQLKDKQMLVGGAALSSLVAYIAYRVHANSEQIEEVHQEVLANGERTEQVQQTLNDTRIEIAQGFESTETSIMLAREDLQKRIAELRTFLQEKLKQQNNMTMQQHQTMLHQFQQVKDRLTLISDQKDVQYNSLHAQISTLEKMLIQHPSKTLTLIDRKFDENFASSEKRTQTYVDQKFNQIEQNQQQMMNMLAFSNNCIVGSSCQGKALQYVSSK